ncbi:hypothetical protein GGR56DRAFT_645179 [Xylariaceae sp. FL0804]|nr:hypothetical protein GGR56DRAFT_645179 [Xylariaceae sp. FL0804]
MAYTILPLTYQSQDIPFAEWVNLFTLCLAPLIAHVFSGAGRVQYLSPRRPAWHDRISHYNPTSILWRYAAMTDRRIRASTWDAHTMAASNAAFWTSAGWDGSESMVAAARPLGTRLPEHSRVEAVSREMLLTVVVTLQGASAAFTVAGALTGVATFNTSFGLDTIFFPVAVFGLLRLSAALWLTDDFHFGHAPLRDGGAELGALGPAPRRRRGSEDKQGGDNSPFGRYMRVDSLPEDGEPGEAGRDRFRPTSYWPSRIFRLVYMLPILGFWFLVAVYVIPFSGLYNSTVTTWLAGTTYMILFTANALCYAYYFIRGRTTSTLIPCISQMWYKLYTMLFFGLLLATICIASIETKRTPCGNYTSLSGIVGDILACSGPQDSILFPIGPESQGPFALASTNPNNDDDAPTTNGDTWLYNFTGSCIGHSSDDSWTFSLSEYSNLYRGSDWLKGPVAVITGLTDTSQQLS